MGQKKRVRHSPEQIVKKLRDADAMLNAGRDLAAVLQALEVSESTLDRWRKQFGGMKSEEARRLKERERPVNHTTVVDLVGRLSAWARELEFCLRPSGPEGVHRGLWLGGC